jgi:DNA invertase Pin-like site-specific DNA recombinase
MAGMLAIFAQFEREILRERVLAGLAHARSKGKVLGPPTTARNKADQIQHLLAAGLSKAQIARETQDRQSLGLPRFGTLASIIRR